MEVKRSDLLSLYSQYTFIGKSLLGYMQKRYPIGLSIDYVDKRGNFRTNKIVGHGTPFTHPYCVIVRSKHKVDRYIRLENIIDNRDA